MNLTSQRLSYLTEVSSWFVPYGMQIVLFPWMVAVVMQGSGSQLGLVQASINLPLLLLPLTGLMAERMNRRALIVWGHIGATIPPLVLIYLLQGEEVRYWMLVAAGLGYGLMSALSMPAREIMLITVAKDQLQRMVTLATATQFGVQALGYLVAGQVEILTLEFVLSFQALVLLAGGLVAHFGLPANAPPPERVKISAAEAFRRLKGRSVVPLFVLNASLGLLYLSSFSVLIPLLLRQKLGSSAGGISAAFISFTTGMVVANLVQSSLPPVKQLGRQAIFSPMLGAFVLIAMVAVPNLLTMALLMFLWGLGAGSTLASSRTLVMLRTPEAIRGRTLAMYQLAFLGTVPIGAAIVGWLADLLSVSVTMALCAGIMLAILLSLILFSSLWQATNAPADPG